MLLIFRLLLCPTKVLNIYKIQRYNIYSFSFVSKNVINECYVGFKVKIKYLFMQHHCLPRFCLFICLENDFMHVERDILYTCDQKAVEKMVYNVVRGFGPMAYFSVAYISDSIVITQLHSSVNDESNLLQYHCDPILNC